MKNLYITSASRTAVGSLGKSLKNESSERLGSSVISDVIKKYCKNKNISFKWPNDVLVDGKKICGILQEVITSEETNFLIIF